MRAEHGRRTLRWAGLALLMALALGLPLWAWTARPRYLRLVRDADHRLQWSLPVPVTVRSNQEGLVALNGSAVGPAGQRLNAAGPIRLNPLGLGRAELDFKLFGVIPLRRLAVDVVPPLRLVPGGHSIGVLLRSQGIMVVGYGPVHASGGAVLSPARQGGIQVGDVIVAVNGMEAATEAQVEQLIHEAGAAGRPVELELRRRGEVVRRTVEPVRDMETGRWRIGLYVRDGAMGIGTLTFFDPVTGRFGALGHVIADGDTHEPIRVREGQIVPATVTAIEPGRRGRPGEKFGVLSGAGQALGTIEMNTRYGIFGRLRTALQNPLFPEAIPVGLAAQVHPGPAEIVTVVEGQRLERFQADIVRVNPARDAEGKNMVVRITDPRLLSITGGIVQGMSGSPIIQDGRLIGAVTHVFVNDPTRGYGVLMEWMLQEAGLLGPGGQEGPAPAPARAGQLPGGARAA